ncbi:MAG: hypothetical protein ACRDJW_26105 [Thermomicrobiales bacterium]
MSDLLETCEPIRQQAACGEIACGINYGFGWKNGKRKTLDLAIGIPLVPHDPPTDGSILRFKSRGSKGSTTPPDQQFSRLLIACEAKSVLTEHSKSQPRVFDELNGSHAIVHGGSRDTIAAGVTLINIAETVVSPLRQRHNRPEIEISQHHQPEDAAAMVRHLRDLPHRSSNDEVGFDAYCSFIMDVNNQGRVELWSDPPAPQPDDRDHYETFLANICRAYAEHYIDLRHLPDPAGLSVEEALSALARQYPGLLDATGQLAVDADLSGAPELHAILSAIELQAKTDTD